MVFFDEEESVPLCLLGEAVKDSGVPVASSVHEDPAPVKPEPRKSVASRMKAQFIHETQQCVLASMLLLVIVGLIALSYLFCQECLFGIMIVSACLCPFLPYFNIPLWISILLITMLGISYVHRSFTFIWK